MNAHIRRLFLPLITLLMTGGLSAVVNAASLSITPNAISNTYSGTITLSISSLSVAGDTVVIRKFLDVNTNGVVDAADLPVQQFQLTDGQASVFTNGSTSVTNFNVPCDIDGSANLSINARLYPALDFSQEIVGKYLFVLSSPLGRFSPVTNSFSVTNFPFAQTITGNVVSNGTAIPNGVVILFQPANGGMNPRGGTVANNAGAFTIRTPPGSYELVAFKTNCLADLTSSPFVTVGASGTITTNVPLINATASISGKIVDTNNTSLGLSGLLIPVQSTNGQFLSIAFTDTNGNFVANVGSDIWKVGGDNQTLAVKGYVLPESKLRVNTTGGNVSGLTIGLPKATAIFYGTVKDNLGNPLPGVDVEGDDNVSNGGQFAFDNTCYTFTNGNFVLGTLSGDGWEVYINSQDQSGIYTNYLFSSSSSQQTGGFLFGNKQAVQEGFTAILATNYIAGNVQFNGSPVFGVGVNGSATIGGIAYQTHADTDSNGNYSMNVANGNWTIVLNCGGGGDGLDDILGAGNYQCPANDNVVINNSGGTASFTVIPNSGGQIFGYVTDGSGNPIGGVNVYASDGLGDDYTNTTLPNGYYSMVVVSGNYTVSVDCGQLTALNYYCVGSLSASISGGSSETDFTTSPITTLVYQFNTLHSFALTNNGPTGLVTNSDGAFPYGGLVIARGMLFGAAAYAGTNGSGTIYAVSTNLSPFTVVHTFARAATNRFGVYTNSEGGIPQASLILASNILYGTAFYGGVNGNGTVFAVNTNGAAFRVLHTFAASANNSLGLQTNKDGINPASTPAWRTNILYATASAGGTNGYGTIFALATNGTFTTIHTFAALDSNIQFTNSDGANPYGALILNNATLYGTAPRGGMWGYGTVFSMNTNGTAFKVLYNFSGGTDGGNPQAGLVLASNTLYGVASTGGRLGSGTVFSIATNGANFNVLQSFNGGSGGGSPFGGLVLSNNTLYGTASSGGAYNAGTVYSLSTSGINFNILYTFTGGNDGSGPYGNLVLSGNMLYGTASSGGVSGSGTVFAVSTGAQPVILSAFHPSGNQFQMLVNSSSGQNYTVQMSTNLFSTNWSTVFVTNPAATTFLYNDPNATNQQRFYRVLMGP